MKRAVTLFAVIAVLGLGFTGCKKKPAEKKADDTTAPAAMDDMMEPDMDAMDKMEPAMDAMDMGAMDMDAMAGGDDFGKIGVAECDAYLKVFKCYIGKMPAAAQGPTKAAFKKTVDAYKKMAAGPGKASLGKSCKMAMDAWSKAVSKMPQYKDCFK
jgi:hypothetical protein